MPFDVHALRAQFPALNRGTPSLGGRPPMFFDNPAGTQVPRIVMDSYTTYYMEMNANAGGAFRTSQLNDAMTAQVRRQFADFFNAASPNEIVFGANMTTLCFGLSRALARTLQPGDEIVLTRMDHDANISPWLLVAQDLGLTVRWVDIDPTDATLDLGTLEAALTDRTRIVATVHASNAVGTINPVRQIAQMAHAAGAYHVVDAVQSAPHLPIDVQDIGCDFLLCSAYKFFGPHLGVMWGKEALLNELPVYKVRPAKNASPDRWETGTNPFESIHAAGAALSYLAQIGRDSGPDAGSWPGFSGDRLTYKQGMAAIQTYEQDLVNGLIHGLQSVPDVTIHGITDPARAAERCPTVVFTHPAAPAHDIAAALAEHDIYVWSGHYYALEIMDRLGHPEDGMLRVGLAHYNTADEVEQFIAILYNLIDKKS